jgi:nitric oxide reductase large subunit
MFADGDTPVLTPFLLVLIFWLVVIFASLGLFVAPGRVVAVALVVLALSISSALFLIADLSRPFAGVMQIPREQLKHTLAPLK